MIRPIFSWHSRHHAGVRDYSDQVKFSWHPSCDDERCDKWSSFLPHDYIVLRGLYRKDKDFGKCQWTRGTFQAPFVRETHFKSSKSFLFILVCREIPSALAQSLGCFDASLYLLSTGSRTCPDCRWHYSRYGYNPVSYTHLTLPTKRIV